MNIRVLNYNNFIIWLAIVFLTYLGFVTFDRIFWGKSEEVFHTDQPVSLSSKSKSIYYSSKTLKEKLEFSEMIWRKTVNNRHNWIEYAWESNTLIVDPWHHKKGKLVFYWNYFPPSFNCPHSMQRVGFMGDGGKWVCGMELFELGNPYDDQSPCIVYSFGIDEEVSFEREILKRTNCQIFAYDHTINGTPALFKKNSDRAHYYQMGISGRSNDRLHTLKDIMEQNGHDWIDILKMDVEGFEFEVFDRVMTDFPGFFPFGQLLLEVHANKGSFAEVYKWWEKMEGNGLRPYQSEVNHAMCGIFYNSKPLLVEYSFLNLKGQRNRVIKGY